MGAAEPEDPALTPTAVDTNTGDAASSVSPPKPLIGYELGALLGRGGMGEVHAARDQRIDRDVAVKRIRDLTPTREAIARFTREARIQARLDHPAIVPVHELGEDADGRPFFTMKRLTGSTLAQRLAQRDPIQPLLRPLVDVCFAIAHAHSRNIVHRDLKPSNIMLGDFGEVYVIDWGIARELSTGRTSAPVLGGVPGELDDSTKTGAMLGTPGYMPPEQMRGDEVTTAFDVFALGAILFEVLTGESLHPLGGEAIAATLMYTGDSPAKRCPGRAIPPELDDACSAAISADPTRRPSARGLAEMIQRYVDGDRDIERRCDLAKGQLELARAALATGDRATSIHAAGRALALDPESRDSAALVTSLLLEPPDELPPDLQRALGEGELELHRQNSRRGARMFFSIVVVLPFFPFVTVASWSTLWALVAAASAMGLISAYNARTGKVPALALLFGSLVVVIAVSRLSSPFMFTPIVAVALGLALAARPQLNRTSWLVIGFVVASVIVPLALEYAHVFAPTWRMTHDGVLMWSAIFAGDRPFDAGLLIGGTVAMLAVVARYTVVVMRGRYEAQRRIEVQAWHLRQLLPRDAR